MTSRSIIHIDLHKPNDKLVNVWLEHFWCTSKPWAYVDSQDSSRLGHEPKVRVMTTSVNFIVISKRNYLALHLNGNIPLY